MADVSRDARGQLMLVSALALAVLLVGLALTLNTAIYTENLATRTTDTKLADAAEYGEMLRAGAGGLVDGVNREGGSYSALNDSFNSSLANWSESAATLTAVRGRVTSVSTSSPVNGTRISQTDQSRNFTDANESTDWNVTSGTHVRNVEFAVVHGSLATAGGSPFTVTIDNGSSTVRTQFYQNASYVFVSVEASGGTAATCRVGAGSGDVVTVDLDAGTVNGTPCAPLDAVHANLTAPLNVTYGNASNARGTYELFVDADNASVSAADPDRFATAGSGSSPVAQEALYAVNVTYVYQSGETYVEREIRVAPGELA